MNALTPAPRTPFPLHFPVSHPRRTPTFPALELGEGLYGPRYYLAGQPVYDGSPLELGTPEGWAGGLFVWSGSSQDRPKLVFLGGKLPPVTLEGHHRLRWEKP